MTWHKPLHARRALVHSLFVVVVVFKLRASNPSWEDYHKSKTMRIRALCQLFVAALYFHTARSFQSPPPCTVSGRQTIGPTFLRAGPPGTVNGDSSPVLVEETLNPSRGIIELTMQGNLKASSIKIRPTAYDLFQASLIGISTGLSVAAFKTAIKFLQSTCFKQPIISSRPSLVAICPAIGGLVVGILTSFGPFREGLKGTVIEVDKASLVVEKYSKRLQNHLDYLRKVLGSVITLGSGCSLGPGKVNRRKHMFPSCTLCTNYLSLLHHPLDRGTLC